MSLPSPIDAARALAPEIRAAAEETEQARRLSPDLVNALASAGLFRMCVPQSLGGGETEASTILEAFEEVSRADGAAGWCVMIGATSGLISAYLSPEVAREIYGSDPRLVTGGVFAPAGRAIPTKDGYQVSGRWPFASGCEHCGWLMGGSLVLEEGEARLPPGGPPQSRLMLFPASQARIIDTWNVSGLRGTGSHDIEVTDLFVPAGRSVSLTSDRPREEGPLYMFPVFGLLALGIAAVAIGIARSAIEELVHLAGAKTPTLLRKRLADRAVIQVEVAQAEAMLCSARAFLFDAVSEAWNAAARSGAISLELRARLRLAATHAATTSASVIDRMYNAGGGTSVYAKSPLQRYFRDAHVLTQHMMVSPAINELVGRVLLGVDTDTSML